MLRSRGDIQQHKLAIAAVLVKIRPGDDKYDALPVRGDLRVGDRGDFGVVV